jgi:N-acetyl-gamma-glutamyl-phosphate reductase
MKDTSEIKHKIFIDGRAGTTGLRIDEYLSARDDIQLIDIDDAKRKDKAERLAKIEEAGISFLCLPDDESRDIIDALDEKARMDGPDSGAAAARVIDASTAHRTNPEWIYGLPEVAAGQRELIACSKRVAMAGCHAAGFILLVRPLIDAGLVPKDYPFTAFSLTGYSGGGKKMIAEYGGESDAFACGDETSRQDRDPLLGAPRQYALGQTHKHLPEMTLMSGAEAPPVFSPIVSDYYAGMEVTVPLQRSVCAVAGGTVAAKDDIFEALAERYADEPFISVAQFGDIDGMSGGAEGGFLSASAMAGRNDAEIYVAGNKDRILLIARYDNLGKGASGSGVQCMNLMLGLPEDRGLL